MVTHHIIHATSPIVLGVSGVLGKNQVLHRLEIGPK